MIGSTLGALAALTLAGVAPGQRDTVLSFTNGTMTLEGTLQLPAGTGPWPAVVIIAGSGPTDRNGNSPAGVSSDTYLLLAQALAERGVASYRYDKRVLPSRKGTIANPMAMTLADFAADAAAAARMLRGRSDIGPVLFLGHSEGGTLAIMAAADGAPVSGLVLVSTAGRDISTIMREQIARQVPPALLAAFDTAWAGYIGSDTAVKAPAGLEVLFQPGARAFMKHWQSIDPVALLRGISIPVLVVQGETDVQVTAADAKRLGSARPDVRVVLLPGVNHVLRLHSGATMAEQAATYTDKSLPLAPAVTPAIADFVLAQPRRSP